MLSITGSVVVIVASVLVSVGLLAIIQRIWEPSRRRAHNDVIGPTVSVIGTMYAVIVAFMLSGVWSDFQVALQNTEIEANALVNVARISRALPSPEREKIQQLTMAYAKLMLSDEWSAMQQGDVTGGGHQIMLDLWTVLPATPTHTAQQQTAVAQALDELSEMTEHRRIRVLQSQNRLPVILWLVLIIGGVITVIVACTFGSDDFKLHAFQVGSLALLVSIALVAIGDINKPFRGFVHVPARGFRYAIESMQEAMNTTNPAR